MAVRRAPFSVVVFDDDTLVAWCRPPFIKYDVVRLDESASLAVYQAVGFALACKANERAYK